MTQERQFPDGFKWGASTAAYQIEGGWNEGGRGMSIWDAFSKIPGKTANGETGDVAIDHFHLYKDDIKLMAALGLKNYRLSFSWTRILPTGKTDVVNEEGIAFYNSLIDELVAHGIEPMVTLFHFDFPLALQLEHDGWLLLADDQRAAHFDRAWLQHRCRCTRPQISNGTIPRHKLLIAHATAVDIYRKDFKPTQNGQIGIALDGDFRVPKPSDDPEQFKLNQDAAERGRLFWIGWFADPIYFGDYPDVMKQRVGDRLPKFTEEESALVKGSNDFFALNHYSTAYAEPSEDYLENSGAAVRPSVWADAGVKLSDDPSWHKTDLNWSAVPWGFRRVLTWIQDRYAPQGGIYVTENGAAIADFDRAAAENDTLRVQFYESYIVEMHKAITEDKADVRGYFAWSLFDNYEWGAGYSKRFGIVWVDYATQERVPKASAKFLGQVWKGNAITEQDDNAIAVAAAASSVGVAAP
ncbi:hypothetical protein Ae201684P_015402 [Aphanomyces euteiches]|nr:hypothetical protein Ae201684P_015402 [Aphanomyces euteiches]